MIKLFLELKRLEDELGPSLHKLETELEHQRLKTKQQGKVSAFDKEFNEIIKKTVLPIMMEYKNSLKINIKMYI